MTLAISLVGRRVVQGCSFELPAPISVNALWMPGKQGGIIKTPAYRNWLTEAGMKLNRQAKERIAGHYALYLTVTDKSRADLGNCEKAVSDLLQEHGIIENDKLCSFIKVSWGRIDGMLVQLLAAKGREAA